MHTLNKISKLSRSANLLYITSLVFMGLFWFIFSADQVSAATMSLSPASGEFKVGETFQVSILLDTEGESVNTIESSIAFPTDRLQLVSPTAGNSIINIYTTPPKYNNQSGRIEVAGGIPGGIVTSKGLITTVTFRARASGTAHLRILDSSKALLNDGLGTEALKSSFGATFKLVLPPPAGPLVSSETHPSQDRWYQNSTAILTWEGETGVEGYSYELSNEPTSLPDNIVDSRDREIIYKNLSDGIHYFHIRSLRGGEWGGVTHFGLKIDTTPPAEFPIKIYPSNRTSSVKPVVEFITTDNSSGIDRYEIKIIPLKKDAQTEYFFTESTSPSTPELLEEGGYEVIIRAYDKAENFREVSQRLDIEFGVERFFSQDGFYLTRGYHIRWAILIPLLLLIILILLILAFYAHRRHFSSASDPSLPANIKEQLGELQKYRSKYGKLTSILVLIFSGVLSWQLGNSMVLAQAQDESVEFSAPVITSHSAKITDEEIFFVNGRTAEGGTEVKLHIQNLYDNQAFEYKVTSDKRGDWTYQHSGFLSPGKYVVWSQAIRGNEASAPSAQETISVQSVAISLNGTKVTYEMFYVGCLSLLIFIIILLATYIVLITKAGKKKKQLLSTELARAEESIRIGFEALKKDLEMELALVRKSGLTGEIAGEEKIREEEIMKDLQSIEKFVSAEILETRAIEGLG